MIDFISIRVRTDNLMYFFYNETEAFCVDSFGYFAIVHALSCEFSKTNYTEDELLSIKPTIKSRKLTHTLTTHNHYDHAGGNEQLKKLSSETVIVTDKNVYETSEISLCEVKSIHTPCHTRNCVCYYVDGNYLLTGDFLFKLGCGKFFEGNGLDFLNSCEKIYENCDESTILLYGHDYYESNYIFAKQLMDINVSDNYFLTLREERKNNPFLNYKASIKKLITENKVLNKKLNQDHQVVEFLRRLKDMFNTENDIIKQTMTLLNKQ